MTATFKPISKPKAPWWTSWPAAVTLGLVSFKLLGGVLFDPLISQLLADDIAQYSWHGGALYRANLAGSYSIGLTIAWVAGWVLVWLLVRPYLWQDRQSEPAKP